MAASGRLCDICETRDITVFATDWCPECEQSLCESCKSHHSAAKLSKTHETIPFESFDKLPSAVKDIKNDCPDHKLRFEYYCIQHELPCCVECMKITHSECRHLTPMHKVVEHFKTSNALSDFEQTLSDLLSNLNSLIKSRFDNISVLADEKGKCLKEITDTKLNVIAQLDTLEIKLKTQIEVLHGEQLQAIEETIKKFEVLKTNVAKMQEEADVIKQYASDFQLFIACTELESTVKSLEKDVQFLMKKDSAKQISISFSPNVELAIETLLPSLGNVNVITKESDIRLVNHRGKQAQLLAIGTPCIEKIQLKPVLENVQLPSGKDNKLTILDSCFLSHGRFAFSDQPNKRLILLKENGDRDRDIQLSFMPSSIAYITDNETAVGKYKTNEINIINMTTSSVDRSFVVKNYGTCAFSFRKGQFLVTVLRVGFCITDIEGNILSEIPYYHDSHSDILFAVLLNDKIYFSQFSKDRIVCCDLKGNEIREFKDKKLKEPLGVVYNDRNVLFITGFRSKNIYALSNTGNEFKELYCNNNLSAARAISYDSSNQQLLLSTQGGNIFLFDVNY
ncbi:uncharacterized protein LOC127711692 [Mytilus californianus]|uniref:uncharacterized protein LOC127711692 n=1 Tax=Mytilus californianus TaxID=6549 RepID=UPI0022462934|nr:uncharacterized protein LOC127711692 [Mytilus californianus]XP_052073763.1 uncharacterized protein LOC127711692 [Mytilus californianus]